MVVRDDHDDDVSQTVSGPAWYVIRAKARQERRAQDNLRSLGLITFLPTVVAPANRWAKTPNRIEPLFPGYLFVHGDMMAVGQKIRYTRGVSRVLGDDRGPTAIQPTIVEAIRARVGQDGHVVLHDDIRVAQEVKIVSGPLKGFVGVFDRRLCGTQRVAIFVNTISAHLRVIVDSDMLMEI